MADPAEPVTDQPGRQEEKIEEVEKAAGEEGGAPTDGESAVAKVNIYKYFFYCKHVFLVLQIVVRFSPYPT